MTLPTSGPISAMMINNEYQRTSTWSVSLDDQYFRSLAQVPGSGVRISYSNFYGKSAYTAMTVTSKGNNSYSGNSYDSAGNYTFNPGINVSGGSGGYTYTWSIVSATDNYTWSISNINAASPNVLASWGGPTYSTCYVQCVVRDSTGHTVTSPQISCYLDMA